MIIDWNDVISFCPNHSHHILIWISYKDFTLEFSSMHVKDPMSISIGIFFVTSLLMQKS